MVQRCIVRGSEWYPGTHINYHTFPKNSVQRSLWLAVLKSALKSKFYESARICSLHFKETDYDLPNKRLKATAVPYYNGSGTEEYNVSSISQEGKSQDPSKAPSSIVTSPSTSYSARLKAPQDAEIIISATTNISASPSSSKDKSEVNKHSLEEIEKPSPKRQCLKSVENLESVEQIYNEANIPVKNIEVGVQVKIKTTTEQDLHKQNKALKQKVVRQNKCIKIWNHYLVLCFNCWKCVLFCIP